MFWKENFDFMPYCFAHSGRRGWKAFGQRDGGLVLVQEVPLCMVTGS
jgi:hypothetical protein